MPHRCTRTTAALLALLAGVVPLVGCSDRGSDSRKVAEAARELGGVGSADAPSGASSYHAASGRIGSLQVSGETAQAVTAGLLSQSLQGEGSVAIKTAMLAERSLFSDLEAALAMGRQYESLATTASALEAFDPAPDLDRIAARVKELEAKSRAAQSERASVAEKIADLESRAESLDAQATTKRDEAAEMKLASSSLSATQAAAKAGTIRELTRAADGLDMQIRRLMGEAETLRPRVTELDAEIAQFAQQRELALEAADDLRAMAAQRRADAQTARTSASQTGEAIRNAVNAIDSDRTDRVIPAGEAATSVLEKSVREADKSARQVRSAGTLGKASAQLRLAEMLHLRAQGHERYATVLEKLSAIDGLSNADAFADAAMDERANARDLRDRAAEAYDNAASSLSSVSVRGTDSARTQQTADRLREIADLLRGTGEMPVAPESDEETMP